jgi:hypothetical protein
MKPHVGIVLLAFAMGVGAADFEWLSNGGRGHVRTNSQASVMARSVYTNLDLGIPGTGLGFAGTNEALRNYAGNRQAINVATNLTVTWTNSSYMVWSPQLAELRHMATAASSGLTLSVDLINPVFNGNHPIAVDLLACPDWHSNGTDTTTINLLTNGEFDATNGWATNTGWTIAGSCAAFAGTSGAALAQTVIDLPTVGGTSSWYTFGATVSVAGAACNIECTWGSSTFTATPPCRIQQTVRNQSSNTVWSITPVDISGGTATVTVDNAYCVPCAPREICRYPAGQRGTESSMTSLGEVTQQWARLTCVIDPGQTSVVWYINGAATTNYTTSISNSIPAGSLWSFALYSLSPINDRGVRNWWVFRAPMSATQVWEWHTWLGSP